MKDCIHFPCALDARCAPWNDNLPRTTRFGYGRRYVRWWLSVINYTIRNATPLDHAGLWWQDDNFY